MGLLRFPWTVARLLALPALISTLLLHNYPAVLQCSFPRQQDGTTAPFRLLVFGDPQLEGDTSLPDPNAPLFPSLYNYLHYDPLDFSRGYLVEGPRLVEAIRETLEDDIPRLLQGYRKSLDLLGNDYYLGHIFRTLNVYLEPTHVTVLGDLLGSQWIDDDEFEWRAWRYWNRVFRGSRAAREEDALSALDDGKWPTRIINIVGNHDIGYASDISRERIDRFERAFGPANWARTFDVPVGNETTAPLRLVVLNSMNLDGPVLDQEIADETFEFVNHEVLSKSNDQIGTILLTHLPLYKPDGICVDGPLFNYGPQGLSEQNHLTEDMSRQLLSGIFGLVGQGQRPWPGLVLTGHDHEGCDTMHVAADNGTISVQRFNDMKQNIEGVRELTVRSMMGSYGGNAYLLSAWVDTITRDWHFEISRCSLGVQHIWWAVHVADLVVVIAALLGYVGSKIEASRAMVVSETARQQPARRDRRDVLEMGSSAIAVTGNQINGAKTAAARSRKSAAG